jgi:hypothetical protein
VVQHDVLTSIGLFDVPLHTLPFIAKFPQLEGPNSALGSYEKSAPAPVREAATRKETISTREANMMV